MFNLQALNSGAIELANSHAFIGDTVALSEYFAVVGNQGIRRFVGDDVTYPSTLIRSLKNDSTIVIDSHGRMSLDQDILAVMLPALRRFMRSRSVLKIFRLDEDATPHLIQERKYVRRSKNNLTKALVQNGWLISVYSNNELQGSIKLCLESIAQITNK